MYETQQPMSLYQVLVNECSVHGDASQVAEELRSLRDMDSSDPQARALLVAAVEKLSGGENTVRYDAAGIPSVMVRIPALRRCDLLADSDDMRLHPAFMLGDKEISQVWVSKYINTLVDGHAASLPMAKPSKIRCFDDALRLSRQKGPGWTLTPFPLQMAIALQCHRQGYAPTGNNDSGQDVHHHDQHGVVTEEGMTLTGSGPVAWTHNGRREGIWDMNGNLNEWTAGFRLMDGEIQLVDMDGLLDPDCDLSETSPLWHAIDAEGRMVPAGSPETLHYDVTGGGIRLVRRVEAQGIGNCAFSDIACSSDVDVSDDVRLLGLYPPPNVADGQAPGWRWVSTEGETLPLCGGAYRAVDHAGIFFMGATKPRAIDYHLGGMRCMYVDPTDVKEVEA